MSKDIKNFSVTGGGSPSIPSGGGGGSTSTKEIPVITSAGFRSPDEIEASIKRLERILTTQQIRLSRQIKQVEHQTKINEDNRARITFLNQIVIAVVFVTAVTVAAATTAAIFELQRIVSEEKRNDLPVIMISPIAVPSSLDGINTQNK